jgi:putative transposase
MKKRKREATDYIERYRNVIQRHHDDIWTPSLHECNDNYCPHDTHSWFSINVVKQDTNTTIQSAPKELLTDKKCPTTTTVNHYYKSFRVDLQLTKYQKSVLQRWFKAFTKMYNHTLWYIKHNKLETFYTLRTLLKREKDVIKMNSAVPNKDPNKTRTKTHLLDCAIKLATANYKSALSNKRNGHIKHFRVRYWRYYKGTKKLEIEPCAFSKHSIYHNTLGKIKAFLDRKPFDLQTIKDTYKTSCSLQYNPKKDKYFLYVPVKVVKDDDTKTTPSHENQRQQMISLDPGIRTFMTGISESEAVCIGDNVSDRIKKQYSVLDKVNKVDSKVPTNVRKKIERRVYRKIENAVDDLHWKTIKFLTSRYERVFIGDMSAKGIISNASSKLQAMTKRVVSGLSFYKFKQRLAYKCSIHGITYREIDERYTSKICSHCGHIHDTLGGSKTFKCPSCNVIMDRDINGCRGIYLKTKLLL